MKVVKGKNFGVYVYSDHPPPHCHVRYSDEKDIQVDIPMIIPRFGETISREVKEIIQEHLDELIDAWEKLNGSHKRTNKKKR
jgi:CRISPR/Cas system CSM-associated protein Csm2 small subunit